MDRPLLLIDVDGVISLFGFEPSRPPAGRFALVDGVAHFLSATAGESLLTLSAAYELVWCSGWEEKANDYLPLALGLPAALPHLTFGRPAAPTRAHWKLAAIEEYAGPARALAWIDDAHDDACCRWAAARAGPTLLVGTDPATGMTGRHVEALLAWARGGAVRTGARVGGVRAGARAGSDA
jgi:hypothetical protein